MIPPYMIELQNYIKIHEGYKPKVYKDSKGIATIGYGRNLEDVGLSAEEWQMVLPMGITVEQSEVLLKNDIEHVFSWISTYPWWDKLSDNRKISLIDMAFNLGQGKFSKFHKMIMAVSDGDYKTAAGEMRDSDWAKEVGQRADNDILLMLKG